MFRDTETINNACMDIVVGMSTLYALHRTERSLATPDLDDQLKSITPGILAFSETVDNESLIQTNWTPERVTPYAETLMEKLGNEPTKSLVYSALRAQVHERVVALEKKQKELFKILARKPIEVTVHAADVVGLSGHWIKSAPRDPIPVGGTFVTKPFDMDLRGYPLMSNPPGLWGYSLLGGSRQGTETVSLINRSGEPQVSLSYTD